MPLPSGARLGPYEVLGSLGAGGMGEVYRARDSALNRDVALKVLPDVFAKDPERLGRFTREAQTLAALNHPNIAHIHGLEQSSDVRALVMELVDGEDLSAIVARGPMPVDEALPIARQIADALEAAHSQGIVHRDLKPANIKVRTDGTVKVLDFGLAKALETTSGVGGPSSVSMSPTLTNATAIGVILGTAAYMAPEQARGKAVDKRADIWAFGCVLYEMLSGRRAFGGDEVSDTLAFVITKDIDWSALPASIPINIRRLLRRCLEKDPKRRWRDIADVRIELDEAPEAPASTAGQPAAIDSRAPEWRRRGLMAAAIVVASALTGVAVWLSTRPGPATPAPLQRYAVTLPASAPYVGEAGGDLAVSPDGRRLVYVAIVGGTRLLWLRRLDELEGQPIRGTEDAFNPFFSPDGEWIGFFTGGGNANGRLKKIAARGGPVTTLAETSTPSGTWLLNDTIVFSAPVDVGWELFQVPASGGTARKLISRNVEAKEVRHGWPEALPGGDTLLFSTSIGSGSFENSRIVALSLASGTYHTVVDQGYHARYVPSGLTSTVKAERDLGHLVYVVGGNLMAVPFDAKRLATTGPAVPLVERVRGRSTTGEVGFAVTTTGSLIYATGGTSTTTNRTLVWVDRKGQETPIAAPARAYTIPKISPDGRRIALEIRDQEFDLWTWDLTRSTLTRLTFAPQQDTNPVWTPDGQRILFASRRSGADNIYSQMADGTGQAEPLGEGAGPRAPYSISPDGKRVVTTMFDAKTSFDIGVLTLDDRKAAPLIQSAFVESNAEISPDGRWVAYQSNEGGTDQIYVRPFPAVESGRWQVSTTGGTRPLWARSGRELFYFDGTPTPTVRVMAVPIEKGATFSAGVPQRLFEGRYYGMSGDNAARGYDVSADGKRFLMIKTETTETPSIGASFVFVVNWLDELRRLVPLSR